MTSPLYDDRWETKRLASMLFENTEKNSAFFESKALQFRFGEIVPKAQYTLTAGLIDTYRKYTIVHPNDLMINGLNLNYDFVTQRVARVQENGIITSAYISLRPRAGINAHYYCYLLKALDSRKIFNGMGTGIRLTLSFNELRNMLLPAPPVDEQERIVSFLDWKSSEAARFAKEKRKQIKLLRELRKSIIDKAVTHGINADVKLKKSGQRWMADIPEHWDMIYSKKLFALRNGRAFPSDEQLTASQKYGVISQAEFMRIEGRRLTVVLTGDDILKHVEAGDFVISMRSFQGGIEYSHVTGKISSAYVMLIPNHKLVYDRYFRWLLKSPSYIKALQGTSDLVRDGQALRYANFAKVYLPQVPLDEQEAIADYLDEMCPKIDAMIDAIHAEIALVQELRTKTISDVVTGKVDVRDVEIPQYEPEADDAIDDEEETDEVSDEDNSDAADEEVE